MGTTFHIKISSELSSEENAVMQKRIDDLLLKVNETFSTYIATSEVSKFNQNKSDEEQDKSAEFIKVLEEALRLSDATQGAYDITVGPLVNLWGFGPSFQADDVPSDDEIEQAKLMVGYKNIVVNNTRKAVKKLNPEIYIDFSSIAKGYGVDKVAELIESKGHTSYMVEIGGEMRVKGSNPDGNMWRIAVENPNSEERSIHKIMKVSNTAIATSGDYRNFFEKDGVKYSHTIDPTTGWPVQLSLASVTVLTDSSMTADAWATAFMVLGSKKGYDLAIEANLAVLFLVKDGEGIKEMKTPKFKRMTEE
jgi:thiamine biosynthesis lipoprotein